MSIWPSSLPVVQVFGSILPKAVLVFILFLAGCSQPTRTPEQAEPIVAVSPSITPTLTVTLPPTLPPPTTRPTDTPTMTPTPAPILGTANDILRVRSGPGIDYAILGKIQAGTRSTLLARTSDSKWFEIAYPDANQRGWVAGDFLKYQGSPELLPVAAAPPTPTIIPTRPATPTPNIPAPDTSDPCAPIPGQQYATLQITSAPTDRPAAFHPDLNLALRGYTPSNLARTLIDLEGASDPSAPKLRDLFGNQRTPVITRTYRVFAWDWNRGAPGPIIDDPEITLIGMQTAPGEQIYTPNAGTKIAPGLVAFVLYATTNRITLKYTRDDNVVDGYTLHIEKVCVEPGLLELYNRMNNEKRLALPALRPGQPLGRAGGTEIGVVPRDKGAFMDPRSRKDWWLEP